MKIASLANITTSPTAGVPERWSWISLCIDGVALSNAIGDLEWENPVQLWVCDHCGTPGCSSNEYAHVSRDDARVYWTRSQGDPDIHVTSLALAKLGGLAFGREAWRMLGRGFGVAAFEDLPEADARVFRDALLDTAGADTTAALLDRLAEDLLASTTLPIDQAAEVVRALVLELEQDASGTHIGADRWRIIEVLPQEYRAECLYLDGRKVLEWPILALYREQVVLRLGETLLLVRGSSG